MWLPGYERIEIAGRAGGDYVGDHPWRVVLHSTEGGSIEGAVAAYKAAGVPPQFTIDPRRRRKAQHVDTDHSAYAVMNQPGGVETNRWRAVQWEIVATADKSMADRLGLVYVEDFTDDDLAFIAGCLTELRAVVPFGLHAPDFASYPQSYGQRASQRMSFDDWTGFDGICGHMHVPENDHGDPGALNVPRIIEHMGGAVVAPTTNDEDGKVLHIIKGDDPHVENPPWFVTDLITKRHIVTPDEAARIVVRTVQFGGKVEHDGNNGPVTYSQADVDAIPAA